MNNAELFEKIFGIYATELWAMPEDRFLKWLNDEAPDVDIKALEQYSCEKWSNIEASIIRIVKPITDNDDF